MNRIVRKPEFCLCENKGEDQLRSNCEADQRLHFRYTDSTISLLPKSNFKILAIFCIFIDRFVSDLVGNPKDRFSRDGAHTVFKLIRKIYGKAIMLPDD